MKRLSRLSALAMLGALGACSGTDGTNPDGGVGGPDSFTDPATQVALGLSADEQEAKAALDELLSAVRDLDATGFAARTHVEFEELSYDPTEAIGLDLIEASRLGLRESERSKLAEQGFVISSEREFPTFSYGYAAIYGDDLPVFVSADSILYAVHRSYDAILKAVEEQTLIPVLEGLLDGMRIRLPDLKAPAATKKDVDLFLTVAASLLEERQLTPSDESLSGAVGKLYEGCVAARGVALVELFGAARRVDFSQCEPRGHYTDSEALKRYFRAMMWLGRIDFRFIDTQEDGSQVFRRRQLESVLALRRLMNDELFEAHQIIDRIVTAFVGEHDYMSVPEVDRLRSDLGLSPTDDLDGHSDQQLAQAIVDGGYGTQRISSHYMVNGTGSGTLPLSSSFALFGQRYVIDSHVFSNVVFDRAGGGTVPRMMPDPLDVAYAALENDHAGMLLAPELEKYDYASDLATMRVIVDAQKDAFWNANLYNLWLGSLRTLSPASARGEGEDALLPTIAKTERWGRRLLNAQLASWAELRHDTILYAKQSYTAGIACEFPDAYVDPYPQFFAGVQHYADHAAGVLSEVPLTLPAGVLEHFATLSKVSENLREMAEHQRTGTPHSVEHMAFINDAVRVEEYCGGASAEGWYPKLFFGDSTEFEPTIADVHTQPTDESGAEVGRVLHVGTGPARLMVVTVETCSGPRAYAGLASSYYELVTEDFTRLTDPEWETRLYQDRPRDPQWVAPLLP